MSRTYTSDPMISSILLLIVDDASGHYTTGFFWGNNYWTGSMILCRSIYKTDEDDFFSKKQGSNVGLPFSNGNVAADQLQHSNPPFLPRFGVLKVVLNESHTTPTVSASHVPSRTMLTIQISAPHYTHWRMLAIVLRHRRCLQYR